MKIRQSKFKIVLNTEQILYKKNFANVVKFR